MTNFGKVLVVLTLGMSLGVMIVAINLFIYRTDWSNNPPKEGKPAGTLVARAARVRAAWVALPDAERDWRQTQTYLLAQEARRRDNRRWYDVELAKLDTDPNPKKPTQLREVVTDNKGMEVYDDTPDANYPNARRLKMNAVMDRGTIVPAPPPKGSETVKKPLVARNVYDYRENNLFLGGDDVTEGLLAARTRDRKAVESHVENITRMLGPKGLHTRLQEEKAKREGVIDEYKAVLPILINTAASSQFAIERTKDYGARVEELKEKRNELRRKLGIAGEERP
jgi:hypothetical protein